MTPHFIEPDWPAPAGVLALATTRQGGASAPPFDSFNLAHHVGDDPEAVAANRNALVARLPAGASIQWLQQVHGTRVVSARASDDYPEADASVSREPGIACAVLTADCLPVILCDRAGTVVAAAHAGWRGLAAGVLEATVDAMGEPPAELMAWLGPAIGPGAFEVGPEVRTAFCQHAPEAAACFRDSPQQPGHYLADIHALARQRLASAGLEAVYGRAVCTFSDPSRFFSYRRDGESGRMATLILLT